MVSLPLANRNNRNAPNVGGNNKANANLVFNKFINCWARSNDGKYGLFNKNKSAKLEWIERFTQNKIGDANLLARAVKRQKALVKNELKQVIGSEPNDALLPVTMINDSSFVTGMGYEHATENGFFWHHSFGVPYLPGSSIKGLMRAFADHWQALEAAERQNNFFERITELFGNFPPKAKGEKDRDISPEQRKPKMGRLIVFDALPVEPVQLVAEILTPHDGGWRKDGAKIMTDSNNRNIPGNPRLSPGDWHDPVPVPFLAVRQGNKFQFALGLARGGTKEDLEEGYTLLKAALEWIGIGAKTASGFGRFNEKQAQDAAGR